MIGKRIRYFRQKHGLTLQALGMEVGFPGASADVRIAQYENESRKPKRDLTATLANALGVSPSALTVPDIDSDVGLMHTLFVLEDLYDLKPFCVHGEVCLRMDAVSAQNEAFHRMLADWYRQTAKLKRGEITREEYDRWRYTFS